MGKSAVQVAIAPAREFLTPPGLALLKVFVDRETDDVVPGLVFVKAVDRLLGVLELRDAEELVPVLGAGPDVCLINEEPTLSR